MTTYVPFSQLYDQILPYLPAAEIPIVDSQIRKAVREFMKRTTIERESFAFTTQVGVSDYRLLPSAGMVSAVMAVYLDPIAPPIPVIPEDRRLPAEPGAPRGWFTTVPDLLTVYPTPDAEYAVTCNAAITLDQAATELPEDLVKHYGEAIAAGVLSLMMDMPGKPWSQPQAAKGYGRVFSGMIKTLRSNLREGGQPNQSTFRGVARFGA